MQFPHTLVAGTLAVFASALPFSLPAQSRADGLEAAEEIGDWLKDIADGYSELQEQSRKLSDLRARIVDARENPASLSGESYAQLLIELTMLIPDEAGLPSEIKTAVKTLIVPVSKLIAGATDFALANARRNFKNQMNLLAGDTSMSESEKAWTAAKRAGSTRQVQLRLLLDWSLEKANVKA
ncbi:MAG: hypothetical protein AB1762_12120 [Gemmatimonadota bacterium]